MIKLTINGVVVKEFTLHNDSVGFVPYTIDTFATYTRPMYYQPVYQPQPIPYIQPSMTAMCANTMPAIEEPVVENKPIRLFKTRHIEYDEARIDDKSNDATEDVAEGILSSDSSRKTSDISDVCAKRNKHGFDDLSDIGNVSRVEFDNYVNGLMLKETLLDDYNKSFKTVSTFLPDTDFDIDSERTRNWIMSGRAYIWYTAQKLFVDKLGVHELFTDHDYSVIYDTTIGLICAFCKKNNVDFPTPFTNSSVFNMPLVSLANDADKPVVKDFVKNLINAKAGGMYA